VRARAGPGLRLAKIVATLGPASCAPSVLRALVDAGLDVARLNFSHGTAAEQARTAANVRAAARRAGRPVALLQDLQGPRIRLGALAGDVRELRRGGVVELVAGARPRAEMRGIAVLPVGYAPFAREVRAGERVLLRDGRVELRVDSVRGDRVRCEVVRGGEVRSRSGMNLPESRLSARALTSKDRGDLAVGARIGVDAVALSFVRSARDVIGLRRLLGRSGRDPLIVAKIERREALEDLDAILRASDGVMVARGDLGVEVAAESVPLLQKETIRRAIRAHAFVITATQMLESMVANPSPTRAEVSDVANAVLDGTDAVMLSAETAIGAHPVEAVATLDRILRHVERESAFALPPEPPPDQPADDFIFALAGAAIRLGEQAGARALMPFTMSGRTAAIVATYRPEIPILACSPDPRICRRLGFWRAVHPMVVPAAPDLERTFAAGIAAARRARLVARGDALVLIGGHALTRGGSNTLQVVRILGPGVARAKRSR